jgi:hypothetical protein
MPGGSRDIGSSQWLILLLTVHKTLESSIDKALKIVCNVHSTTWLLDTWSLEE